MEKYTLAAISEKRYNIHLLNFITTYSLKWRDI
jgi:hypothetical protein